MLDEKILNAATPQQTARDALLEKNKGRVCTVPFNRFDVWRDGRVPVCCTDWMQGDVIIGNIFEQELGDIWNSPAAKRLRRSVTDGSFAHCTEKCPLLAEARLPLREDLSEKLKPFIENPEQDLPWCPSFIKLVNDDTCNLSCPSCRHEVFVESKEGADRIAERNLRVVYPMLEHAKVLDVVGNGEAIASRATMRLLNALDPVTHKNLAIDLLTNATKFNASAWLKLSNIHGLDIRLNVSADGATKPTYEKLRRGGKWEEFNENMAFIAGLRREGGIRRLTLNFTVQADNFRELRLFGEMARRYNADRVILFRFLRWPHMSDEQFAASDIFDPAHPDHGEFLTAAKDFHDPIVETGPLAIFVSPARSPS